MIFPLFAGRLYFSVVFKKRCRTFAVTRDMFSSGNKQVTHVIEPDEKDATFTEIEADHLGSSLSGVFTTRKDLQAW